MRSLIAPVVAVSFMLGVVPSFAQGLPNAWDSDHDAA
jgi:hypothetical protein